MNLKNVIIVILVLVTQSYEYETYKTDPKDCCYLDPLEPNDGCKTIVLTANKKIQYFETPLYPLPFPKKLICTWAITINPGSRIHAVIEKFHLIIPDESGCYVQTIMIRSPATDGLKMGPFCGKTGIPIVNTPDNILLIQLIDLGSKSHAQYNGFKVKFLESYETPNIELRPQGWFHNEGVPFTMNYAQLNYVVSQIDPAKNVELKIDVPNLEEDQSLLPTKVSITKTPLVSNNKRRRPISRRPTQSSMINKKESRHWLQRDQPGVYDRVPNELNKKTNDNFKIEYIIGIAVGGFVVISLVIVALIKCYLVKRAKVKEKKKKKEELNYKRNYDEQFQLAPATNKKQKYLPYDHRNKCYRDKKKVEPMYYNTTTRKSNKSLPKTRNNRNLRDTMPNNNRSRYK